MKRLVLLTILLCPLAIADSVDVTSTCGHATACTDQIVDQYGDHWSYVQYDISPSSGSIDTSLAFTNAILANHPDATPTQPSGYWPFVSFTSTWDLPVVDGTLNVFLESFGGTDECEGCTPYLSVGGLPNNGVQVCCDGYTEYKNVAPGTVIGFSSNVSTIIQDSTDILFWDAFYEVAPIPEPASWASGGLALLVFGAWRIYVRKYICTQIR